MQHSTGSSVASSGVDLHGRWQLAGWFVNVSGHWKHYGEDKSALSIWNIKPDNSISVEDPRGGAKARTVYTYDAEKFFLRMDWPNGGAGRAPGFGIDKIFRVMPLSDDMVALYDLEGVFAEPDDYLFMIVMKKLPDSHPD